MTGSLGDRASSPPTTLYKSYVPVGHHAPSAPPQIVLETAQGMHRAFNNPVRIEQYNRIGSTAKGIMIGIFSVLAAALLVLILAVIVYYFRYTQQGRIFLDRITRPGEYDDEQQFAKEEAEALEEMDDIQRTEYLRAKGTGFHRSMNAGMGTNALQPSSKLTHPNPYRPTFRYRSS
jgi:hypothetical protein